MVWGGEGIPPRAELCVHLRHEHGHREHWLPHLPVIHSRYSFIHDYFKYAPSPYEVAGTAPGNYEEDREGPVLVELMLWQQDR